MPRGLCLGLLALTSCALGAGGRLEGTLDTSGRLDYGASFEPALGVAAQQHAAYRKLGDDTVLFVLFGGGIGWGAGRVFLTTGVDLVGVPSPDGGAGVALGFHFRADRVCQRFGLEAGAVGLIAEPHLDERGTGPVLVQVGDANPTVTRVYHELTVVGGWLDCGQGERLRAGLAYKVGVAGLVFTPGP